MQYVTFRMKEPIGIKSRAKDGTATAAVDCVRLRRREAGDGEPNHALASNCADRMLTEDGQPVSLSDLLPYHVEEGLREAMRAALATVGCSVGPN
jgi:hypothetical protein